MDDLPHNIDFFFLETHVAPTQAEQLALAEARSGNEKDQGPGQKLHSSQNSPNFIGVQNGRVDKDSDLNGMLLFSGKEHPPRQCQSCLEIVTHFQRP